ncbi:MAG: hypothetical protein AB9835_05100 [Eubacteriales bacterium]
MTQKTVLMITQTAMLLALTIAAQTVFRAIIPAPASQFVVGSLVNLFLVMSVTLCGLWSGSVIAILAPIIALMMGQITIIPQIFIVGAGNLALVLSVGLIFGKMTADRKLDVSGTFRYIAAAATGSLVKFVVLWFGMVKIILPIFVKKPELLVKMSAAFSWPQIVTAAIGCTVAFVLLPLLRRFAVK